jgi:hypothetical protein
VTWCGRMCRAERLGRLQGVMQVLYWLALHQYQLRYTCHLYQLPHQYQLWPQGQEQVSPASPAAGGLAGSHGAGQGPHVWERLGQWGVETQ